MSGKMKMEPKTLVMIFAVSAVVIVIILTMLSKVGDSRTDRMVMDMVSEAQSEPSNPYSAPFLALAEQSFADGEITGDEFGALYKSFLSFKEYKEDSMVGQPRKNDLREAVDRL